jgi:hypothetical protein
MYSTCISPHPPEEETSTTLSHRLRWDNNPATTPPQTKHKTMLVPYATELEVRVAKRGNAILPIDPAVVSHPM